LVILTPNRKGDCAYGVQLLGILKYDRIDIQLKVFDGANGIPTLSRTVLKYKFRAGYLPDLLGFNTQFLKSITVK